MASVYGPINLLKLITVEDSCRVSVFEAEHRAFGKVAATVYKDPTAAEVYLCMKNALLQAISAGPEASKVLDTQFVRVHDSFELLICTVPVTRSLADEITARKDANQSFTDSEVRTAAKSLVQSLASAQQHVIATQSVSHGNVQPCSIAMDVKGEYRLQHFAGGVAANNTVSQQICGFHPYMSPVLQDAVAKKQSEVAHNAYRSDVFSLGLTLFSMCSSQLFTEEFQYSVRDLQGKISEWQRSEDVKKLVRMMLAPAESDRPDFLSVEMHFWDSGPCTNSQTSYFDSQCCSFDFNSCMDSPQYVPKSIEKLWFEFLKKQWECCGEPLGLYCFRGDLMDSLQNVKEVDTSLWDADWIPIRELVAEKEVPSKVLRIFKKAADNEFRPLQEIPNQVSTFAVSDGSCSFTITRRGEQVTISEDPSENPCLTHSLSPRTRVQLLPNQLYYLGPARLTVHCIEPAGLVVDCIERECRRYQMLRERGRYTIGRTKECDIILSESEEMISKVHAEIRLIEDRWFIADMGSRNGTWALCHSQCTQYRRSFEVRVAKEQEFRTSNSVFRYTLE